MGIFDFIRKPKEETTKEKHQGVAPCGGPIEDHYIAGEEFLFCAQCAETLKEKFHNPPPVINIWL